MWQFSAENPSSQWRCLRLSDPSEATLKYAHTDNKRKRERERERESERERERETDRQRERGRERLRARETERGTKSEYRQIYKSDRNTERQTDGNINKVTDRQTFNIDLEWERKRSIQRDRHCKPQTDRETERQTKHREHSSFSSLLIYALTNNSFFPLPTYLSEPRLWVLRNRQFSVYIHRLRWIPGQAQIHGNAGTVWRLLICLSDFLSLQIQYWWRHLFSSVTKYRCA